MRLIRNLIHTLNKKKSKRLIASTFFWHRQVRNKFFNYSKRTKNQIFNTKLLDNRINNTRSREKWTKQSQNLRKSRREIRTSPKIEHKKTNSRKRAFKQIEHEKNKNRSNKQQLRRTLEASLRTYTPPATPPATRDLQTLRKTWLGALTPSLACFASSARLTIVVTADSLVVFPTTSSDAISEPQKDRRNPRVADSRMAAIDGLPRQIYRRVRTRMPTHTVGRKMLFGSRENNTLSGKENWFLTLNNYFI